MSSTAWSSVGSTPEPWHEPSAPQELQGLSASGRESKLDPAGGELVGQVGERVERLDVEVGALREVEDDRRGLRARGASDVEQPLLDVHRVRVEERPVDAGDDEPGRRGPVRVPVRTSPGAGGRIARERPDGGPAQSLDQDDQREHRGDDEAGEDAEREHPDQRDQREDERARAERREPAQLVDAPEAGDRDDHDRRQRRLR